MPLISNHSSPTKPPDSPATFVLPEHIEWHPIIPSLGDRSPRHAVLHQDARTGAAVMLVWLPRNFHVPEHWHSTGEKHFILQGKLAMKCPTGQCTLPPGAFNFIPAHMPHEAWTDGEDCLLLNTTDGEWDVHWTGAGPAG